MVASFIPRRVRRTVSGAGVLLAISGLAAACGTNDGVDQTIAIVGSDTTQDVMAEIAEQYNADTGYNADPDVNENVVAQVNPPPDNGHTVVSDGVTTCPTRTYRTPTSAGEFLRPNGSSAGRDALSVSVQAGNGCVDIARSSGPPRAIGTNPGQDLASFEYYAFALDAVGATTASTLAPADRDLTQNELRDIYRCNITNWSQIGGGSGPIERYWSQPGSGTTQFSQSDLLGFDPTNPVNIPNCGGVLPTITQENTGEEIAANGDQQRAIVNYSVANYSAMSQDTFQDDRFGQLFFDLDDTSEGTLGPVSPVVLVGPDTYEPNNAVIAEGNVRLIDPTPAYPAVRFVFNVIDNSSGANSYNPSLRFVGFQNVASPTITSPLCTNAKASTLLDYGFSPLTNTANPTTNIPGTYCRQY